jgi:Tol biopolymer transport system component
VLLLCPIPLAAQYFGRNKVRSDDFRFTVLQTAHFDVYSYPEEARAVQDAVRMSERWYERYARTFQLEFARRKPIILYADHADFEQTNIIEGRIDEATGGVTESLKDRVFLPLASTYQETDHVLGHELVHAFQYDVAKSRGGVGAGGLEQLPLWMVEGMAEYLSLGRESPLTAMWLRDAVLREDFPTVAKLERDPRYFPYRFGHALLAYVGGTYGDSKVLQLFREALRRGTEIGFQEILGVGADTLSAEWRRATELAYRPLMQGRILPGDLGRGVASRATGAGEMNLAPSVSPDGRYVAFLSEKDLFAMKLYLAETATGRIIRTLGTSGADPEYDALNYLDASGSWSPDGTQLAFVVTTGGDNRVAIVDVASGDLLRTIRAEGIGGISGVAWSPDGRTVAFSGSRGGISDLYLLDLTTERVTQLTDDRYADLQPAWSPDGGTLAFVTDRGPDTDLGSLRFGLHQLAFLDLRTLTVELLPLFRGADHVDPHFSPDGQSLYFLSDQDGFPDVYRVRRDGRELVRITRVATGVSGLTRLSPAFTLARDVPVLVMSVFDERGFEVRALDGPLTGTPVRPLATARGFSPSAAVAVGSAGPGAGVVTEGTLALGGSSAVTVDVPPGRMLPPIVPYLSSQVSAYLRDAESGLVSASAYPLAEARSYSPGLALDAIGPLSVGLSIGRFGTYFGGNASATFSDMLGDRLLGAQVFANGGAKDVGGQLVFINRNRRINWGLGVARTPYVFGFETLTTDPYGRPLVEDRLYHTYVNEASGLVAYPLSSTRRVETQLGVTRYSFDFEVDETVFDDFGNVIRQSRRNADSPASLNLAHASVAFVHDNAFFGFTSPVTGSRSRVELEGVAGTVRYGGLLLDYRRYVRPASLLTVALRGYHYGRYGNVAALEEHDIQPLFLGNETLIRGYAYESFDRAECSEPTGAKVSFTGCAELDRLFGNRLAVANLELRVPLTGTERYGVVAFRWIPIELAAFMDAGVAWDSERPAVWTFARGSAERTPVVSTGLSARVNVVGVLVLELYRAYPFQRPGRGWHWGFNIAPGW